MPSVTGPSGNRTGPDASGSRQGRFCLFWVGLQCFAVDVSIVREIVSIARVTPVPLTPPAILGLFNLRGVPFAIVDLAVVLGSAAAEVAPPFTAMLLWSEGLSAAARVDRVEGVIPMAHLTIAPPADESPMIEGFFTKPGATYPVAVLRTSGILEALNKLKVWEGNR